MNRAVEVILAMWCALTPVCTQAIDAQNISGVNTQHGLLNLSEKAFEPLGEIQSSICYEAEVHPSLRLSAINNPGDILAKQQWNGATVVLHPDGSYTNLNLGYEAEGRAINDYGLVVGTINDYQGGNRGFLWAGPESQIVFQKTGFHIEFRDINNLGEIVGSISSNYICTQPLFLRPSVNLGYNTDIGEPDCDYDDDEEAVRINDRGRIAIVSNSWSPWSSIIALENLKRTDILSGLGFLVSDMNNAGVAVGNTGGWTGSPAIWSNGELQYLPIPPEFQNYQTGRVMSVNSNGEIVGSLQLPYPGQNIPFVYREGQLRSLESLLCSPDSVNLQSYINDMAINDSGVIILSVLNDGVVLRPVATGDDYQAKVR